MKSAVTKSATLSNVISSLKRPSSSNKGHYNTRKISSNINVDGAPIRSLSKKWRSAIRNMMNCTGGAPNDETVSNCNDVKSFDSIPQPRSFPLFGSVLDYTPLGKFNPMEFDKALNHRHNE